MLIEREDKQMKREEITKARKMIHQEEVIKDYLLPFFKELKNDSWELINKFEKIIDDFTDLFKKKIGSITANKVLKDNIKIDYNFLKQNIINTAGSLEGLLKSLEYELSKNWSLARYYCLKKIK